MNKRIIKLLKQKIDEATPKEIDEALMFFNMVDSIREQAKKEVFDDIDKFRSCGRSTDYVDIIDMSLEDYAELKKKHLVKNN